MAKFISLSLRGESNDRREFDSTKQSRESKHNLKGLLRRSYVAPRNDVLGKDLIRQHHPNPLHLPIHSHDALIHPRGAGILACIPGEAVLPGRKLARK